MIYYIYLVTKKQKIPTPTKIAGSFRDKNKNDFVSKKERKKEGGKGGKKENK